VKMGNLAPMISSGETTGKLEGNTKKKKPCRGKEGRPRGRGWNGKRLRDVGLKSKRGRGKTGALEETISTVCSTRGGKEKKNLRKRGPTFRPSVTTFRKQGEGPKEKSEEFRKRAKGGTEH